MSIDAVGPLRRRMIEDMNARKLCAGTQRGHIRSCKRFAAFLKRSPDTATIEDSTRNKNRSPVMMQLRVQPGPLGARLTIG
jgi:hypothetical protein